MSYLASLNPAQLEAVQHDPSTPLQILAGPGSGKTKVLTCRIAHLIQHHSIDPSSLCAITFTNKAANEMRERLVKLIGKEQTAQIKMGTFHAFCALFLRKYSKLIGLEGNFTVCDADESKKIVTKLLKSYDEELESSDTTLKAGTVMSFISKAKSKGVSPKEYLPSLEQQPPDNLHCIVAAIYKGYAKTLRANNSLDFDDLLCYGVKLFEGNAKVVDWCRHVLVDEFQDTNGMQYELMKCISAAHKCVTIVGDPDQSIYGWRSAEIANLGKMRKDFHKTRQILLEHNYRSSQSILAASLAIVAQDKNRISKSLFSSHPAGPPPALLAFPTEHAEASFIASEIKRISAHMGGMFTWNDFVVLLRFNALSRTIESALQKEGIPSRVLGGHKFFERLEIKDVLAYLQLVDNPMFVPAFVRVINVPPRGIGDKTIAAVIARAEMLKISPLAVINQIHDGKIPDIKPAIKNKIRNFVQPVRKLTKLAAEETSPSDLIRRLLELIEYEAHLKKSQADWESRWENVQELLTFAGEVETRLAEQSSEDETEVTDFWMDGEAEVEVDETDEFGVDPAVLKLEEEKTSPLRAFLQASMLSTDTETQGEGSSEKVTISTCHAAKGLEWPAVMVPAVEQGTFPSTRAEDVEEERRLLYVACTRAQGLLYLTHSTKRMFAGESKTKDVSEFITTARKDNWNIFAAQPRNFTAADRALMATICGRTAPAEAEVRKKVEEFDRTINRSQSQYGGFVTGAPVETPQYVGFQRTTSLLPASDQPKQVRPPNSMPRLPITQGKPGPLIASGVVNARITSRTVSSAVEPTKPASLPRPKPISAPAPAPARPTAAPSVANAAVATGGTKRRLGMGRSAIGYFPNKKFKGPTSES